MKLSFDEIKSITTGAVRFEERDGMLVPHRFTKEQYEYYRGPRASLVFKCPASSGIRLCFKTDSTALGIKINAFHGTTRKYFMLEVFSDGERVGDINNFTHGITENYVLDKDKYELGDYGGEFSLGEGEKTVTVFLPWSVGTAFREITLDDGATLTPVKREKTLLVYGDSVTQGYDAAHPSKRYMSIIADKLSADEYNKAIGGEQFRARLAELPDELSPDYIIASYGSNDWKKRADRESFTADCRGFYENLRANYPSVPIFALTPIWRLDKDDESVLGDFDSVGELIADLIRDIEGVAVISGRRFVPEDTSLFGDFRLHPNDAGFEIQAESLWAELEKYVK